MSNLYTYGRVTIERGVIMLNQNELFRDLGKSADSFFNRAYEELVNDYPKFYKMDGLSKLGFLASDLLCKELPWLPNFEKDKVAICIQTNQGCLETDLRYLENIQDPMAYFPSPSVFVYTLPNIVMGEISIRQGFKGENLCLLSEQKDWAAIELMVKAWIAAQETSLALVGWMELDGNSCQADFYLIGAEREKSISGFPQPS